MLYPTGSRWFGVDNKGPGWDFFTKHTRSSQRWLLNNDFKILKYVQEYKDRNCLQVVRCPYKNTHITIQMVDSVEHKQYCQRVIKDNWMTLYTNLSKSERYRLWNFVGEFTKPWLKGTQIIPVQHGLITEQHDCKQLDNYTCKQLDKKVIQQFLNS